MIAIGGALASGRRSIFSVPQCLCTAVQSRLGVCRPLPRTAIAIRTVFNKTTLTHPKQSIVSHQPGSPLRLASNKGPSPESALWNPDIMGHSIQPAAGRISSASNQTDDDDHMTFIPQVSLHARDGRQRKRVLMLCTGGTLTMAPDSTGALAPVQGALSSYVAEMKEFEDADMPQVVLHEYTPFVDSSDLGPADWVRIASDIRANYLYYDGFCVLTGTDTMAYLGTALSFLLENLGKPVVVTGSQIPLCRPYNDARRNLILACWFAARDSINEVTVFFHDRLLRANRTTKIDTHALQAFGSPNIDPLATVGVEVTERTDLLLPPAKGPLRVHERMDTRLLALRLVPGFDDAMISAMIQRHKDRTDDKDILRALVLQLYGTGNLPSIKESFIQLLAQAHEQGIFVVAASQCPKGAVLMGHYAVGKALAEAGVISAHDMTTEAIVCKLAYLLGRGDLDKAQVSKLMGIPLRGELTLPALQI